MEIFWECIDKYMRLRNKECPVCPKHCNSAADQKATTRSLEFLLGWFADPVVFGDYPKSMRSIVERRLPNFSKEESELLKGLFDFLGLIIIRRIMQLERRLLLIGLIPDNYEMASHMPMGVKRSYDPPQVMTNIGSSLASEHSNHLQLYWYNTKFRDSHSMRSS